MIKNKDIDQIKDIIPRVIEHLSSGEIQKQNKIYQAWQGLLDKKIQKHTSILGIKNDILMVNVDTPPWLYQMRLKKKTLLKSLQKKHPEINNIIFKIGKI